MNNEQKTRIRKSIFAGLFFGVMMGIFNSVMQQEYALFAALLSGFLFGISIYFFWNTKQFDKQTKIDVDDKEIIYSDLANHFIKGESVGGKLYLLGDKLIFKSHLVNLQNHQLNIDLKEVVRIDFFSTFGIIPNGLNIATNSKSEKFIVNNRKIWKSKIEKALNENVAAHNPG